MKNITELIEYKEQEIVRVRKEVEALRIAAPLLGDEERSDRDNGAGSRQVIEMP